VDELIAAVGATSVQMDATAHDREIAVVSHLPHALAGVLVQLADGPHPVMYRRILAGSHTGRRSRSGLWAQIFIANRAEVSKAIENAQEKLSDEGTSWMQRV